MDGIYMEPIIADLHSRYNNQLNVEQLLEIEQDICALAKQIFPELENLGLIPFNLKKQTVWIKSYGEPMNPEYLRCYECLIRLQDAVRGKIKDCNEQLDVPLDESPLTAIQLEPKPVERVEKEFFNSTLSELQNMNINFDVNDSIYSATIETQGIAKLIKADPEKEKKKLALLRFSPNHQELFISLASFWSHGGISLSKGLEHLFDVLDLPSGEIGLYSLLLKIRCLEACAWLDSLKNYNRYIREARTCCDQLFNPNSWSSIKKSILETFAASPKSANLILFPIFSRGMYHYDKHVRRDVVQAVSLLYHLNPAQSIIHLKKGLEDQEPEVREAALYGLSRVGKKQLNDVFGLFKKCGLKLTQDPSPSVRKTFAWTLGQKGICNFEISTSCLVSLLRDSQEDIAQEAMSSLCKIPDKMAKHAVNSLQEYYEKAKRSRKEKIITIFGEWGRGISTLAEATKELHLRTQAFQALKKIGSNHPEAILSLLFTRLVCDDSFEDNEVLQLLIFLGKEHPDLTRKQIQVFILAGNIEAIAHYLIKILGEIGDVKSFEIITEITKRTNNNSLIESATAYAIGLCFKKLQVQGLSLLQKFLENPNEIVRISAIQALGHFAFRGKDDTVFPPHFSVLSDILQKTLNDPSADIRKATIESLVRLGEYAWNLVSPLINDRINQEQDRVVRGAIIESIAKIGKNNPEASSCLYRFNTPQDTIRNRVNTLNALIRVDSESVQRFLITRLQPLLKEWNKLVFEDGEEELYLKEIFDLLSEVIKGNILPNELFDIKKFFIDSLHHPNTKIKINTIKVLPKLNVSNETIIELLKIAIDSNLEEVIQAMAILQGDLQLEDSFIKILEKMLIANAPNQEDAFKILCQCDLSPYPDLILHLMKAQKANPLKSTPLDHLLTHFASCKSTQVKSYLLATVHKCLTNENLTLFVEGDWLCTWESNQIKKIIEKNKIVLKAANYEYQKALFEWRAEALENNFYALAGHYYRKAGNLEKMMVCYKRGEDELAAIESALVDLPNVKLDNAFSLYPQRLEQSLQAICYLGICYQTGVGIKPKEEDATKATTEDMMKAAKCYTNAAKFKYPLGVQLYSLCSHFGLGIPKMPQTDEFFSPFPLHVFNLSNHAYLLDEHGHLVPAGTISLALATLEPTIIDRDKAIDLMSNIKEKKIRPDHKFICPYIELHPHTGDLIILIPESLSQHISFIEKLLQLGLVKKLVIETRQCGSQRRRFTIEFVVPKSEIKSFLRDELHLNDKVYFELMEVQKGKK